MADLHLLDIRVLPCAYVKDVIEGVWRNLHAGMERSGGKKVYGFKVVGENRLVAILDGGVEMAMASVTAAYGDQTNVTCTPLRSFELFAEHVLGVDNKVAVPATQKLSGQDGRLFWLHFTIEYDGLKSSDLIAIWAREAINALTLRSQGTLDLEMYKVVAQREVHMFAKIRDSDILDDLMFTMPIMKELGNQTHIVSKSIIHLPDQSPPQS